MARLQNIGPRVPTEPCNSANDFVRAVQKSIINVKPESWSAPVRELVSSIREWMHEYKRSFAEPVEELCKSHVLRSLFLALREQGSTTTSPIGYTQEAINVGLPSVLGPLLRACKRHWQEQDLYIRGKASQPNAKSPLPFDPATLNELLVDHISHEAIHAATEWRLRTWAQNYTVLNLLQLDPKTIPYDPGQSFYGDVLRALNVFDTRIKLLFKSTKDLGFPAPTCQRLREQQVSAAVLEYGQLVKSRSKILPIINGWTLLLSNGKGLSPEERQKFIQLLREEGFGATGRRKPEPEVKG